MLKYPLIQVYLVYLDLHTLGILNSTQSNELTVPDASMHEVKSTSDVVELMSVGLLNRAIGATALNERSSRSHCVLTVHVKGTDLETRAILNGCLHLVDLAGSERVDRSEATGDRLREAQHINKSLSALGDVISALAQNSPHIPYRNSKLTQLLQSSLGGQAKTLMFVQLNPDVESYSETISTLKFAERVSGVELGAARSNTEGRGVRELMDQVAFLQDRISKKDEEIGQLRKQQTNSNVEKRTMKSSQSGSASLQRTSSQKTFNAMKKTLSNFDDGSEFNDKYFESNSQLSTKDFKHPNELFQQSQPSEELESWSIVADEGVTVKEEVNLLGSGDSESGDKLSDMSDGVMSMATETDGSISIVDEYSLFLETAKPPPESAEKHNIPAKLPRPPQKHVQSGFSRLALNNISSKVSSSKKSKGGSSSAVASSKRWQ
ncbi:microtubule binding motor protein [Lithospermum erythrorhizon]|uniref:Microtubule binding motor protein n=1 Tax=Lithospermum erythrorhizon TaxID=34254 RepID=A0AAV3NJI9_LITER